jgi:hypothetical protein
MTVMLIHASDSKSAQTNWSEKFSRKYLPPIIFENAVSQNFMQMVRDELRELKLDEELTLCQCVKVPTGGERGIVDPRGIPFGLNRAQMSSILSHPLSQQWSKKESWVFLGEFEIPDQKYIFADNRRRRFSLSGMNMNKKARSRHRESIFRWMMRKLACSTPKPPPDEEDKITRRRISSSVGMFSKLSSVRGASEPQHTGDSVAALFAVSSLNSTGSSIEEIESRQTSVNDDTERR